MGDQVPRFLIIHDDGKVEEFQPIKTEKVPISDAVKFYLEKYTPKKSKATRTNEKNYFKLLSEFFSGRGVMHLDEITGDAMLEYQEHLVASRAPPTVNRHFQTIRNFFNVHRKKRVITFNPCDEVPHLKIDKPKVHTWTNNDFQILIGKCYLGAKCILTFIWLTGCRSCEAINLTWADIDNEAGYIRFRSKKNSDHYRDFPIDDDLSKFLHTIPLKGLHVFNGFTTDSLGKLVRQIVLEHCENKCVTVKGIRHTFCKKLLQSGMSRPVVQQLMGHKDWRTTENYKHFDSEFLSKKLSEIR